jgi:hypothetical protein
MAAPTRYSTRSPRSRGEAPISLKPIHPPKIMALADATSRK